MHFGVLMLATLLVSALPLPWQAAALLFAVAALVFVPIILLYTAWVYRVMRGPVTVASMGRNPNAY